MTNISAIIGVGGGAYNGGSGADGIVIVNYYE